MRKACRKIVAMVIACILFTSLFTSTAYAAQYIYYDGGLSSATVDVENRLSYYGVFIALMGSTMIHGTDYTLHKTVNLFFGEEQENLKLN